MHTCGIEMQVCCYIDVVLRVKCWYYVTARTPRVDGKEFFRQARCVFTTFSA